MKRLLTTAVLIVLLMATTTSAFAAEGPFRERHRGRSPFALAGTITAIDGTTVTVQVVAGNRWLKPYLGQEVAIQTTATTRFLLKNGDGTVSLITLADLAVGQNVSMNGQVTSGNVFVARRITVGARLVHLP